MDRSDIPFLSATELSALIAKREVSPVEATESYLDRIEGLDFKFNAYLTVLRRQALEAAREAEQSISRGSYLGPMHGIPVAVKDQLWTKGIRTTGGTRLRSGFVPTEDATAIANLKRAGAILLGKTNLTEFALTGFTQVFSHPRNPWDLDTFAGGSSGGSAAATGAFLCATSLGEDTAGSIRMPAAWCGLVGLRPNGRPHFTYRRRRRHHAGRHRRPGPQRPVYLELAGTRSQAGPGRGRQGRAGRSGVRAYRQPAGGHTR